VAHLTGPGDGMQVCRRCGVTGGPRGQSRSLERRGPGGSARRGDIDPSSQVASSGSTRRRVPPSRWEVSRHGQDPIQLHHPAHRSGRHGSADGLLRRHPWGHVPTLDHPTDNNRTHVRFNWRSNSLEVGPLPTSIASVQCDV
jgi:hypothetical protein